LEIGLAKPKGKSALKPWQGAGRSDIIKTSSRGRCLAEPRNERVRPMTITLSDFEVIIIILTILWIYVTWRQVKK
jgi:hypothetical protein